MQVTVRESFKRMIMAVDEERGLDIDSVEQLLNIVHVQLAGHIQEVQDRIEDWKEWFPEEMESIIEREEHIHGEITEVQERISEIVRAIGQAAPSERVSELEVQLETLATRLAELEGLRQLSSYAPVSPRRLVAEGRFTEAIEEYNERIANRPRLHTLYIGRARARAAAGDVRGALADLDHAESLCPDDEAIARVRLSIEADTEEVSPVSWHRIFPILFEGNARLQEGNFQDALQCYEQAQQRGLYTPQALVNKAMAHCLGGDYDTAMCLLDEAIEVVRGPFNEVEICAVRLVCSLLAGREDDEARINLQDALERAERVAPFKLSRSPPRFFQEGLRAVEQYTPEVDNMFQLLES